MTTRRRPQRSLSLAPITVGPDQAAELLSISRDHFERHVQHELRWIRRGRRKLVLVSDLRAWADANAARTLEP